MLEPCLRMQALCCHRATSDGLVWKVQLNFLKINLGSGAQRASSLCRESLRPLQACAWAELHVSGRLMKGCVDSGLRHCMSSLPSRTSRSTCRPLWMARLERERERERETCRLAVLSLVTACTWACNPTYGFPDWHLCRLLKACVISPVVNPTTLQVGPLPLGHSRLAESIGHP